ncbi:hypothetical protein PMI13_03051 [Chryseobacterium populi]|uniref:Uncharacterized protein n=1 Tax=Chryseobacterium populi TaxID=1144316 RepID=J3CEZ2_9FLAO|nr:hypothetical protein PMI13_03051 [Chryseobacterium populi]
MFKVYFDHILSIGKSEIPTRNIYRDFFFNGFVTKNTY